MFYKWWADVITWLLKIALLLADRNYVGIYQASLLAHPRYGMVLYFYLKREGSLCIDTTFLQLRTDIFIFIYILENSMPFALVISKRWYLRSKCSSCLRFFDFFFGEECLMFHSFQNRGSQPKAIISLPHCLATYDQSLTFQFNLWHHSDLLPAK